MSERVLSEVVKRIKGSKSEFIVVTHHCRQNALARGISVEETLDYFLNTECEWQFSKEKGVGGRRVEVLKRLSNRRGLLGIFEANEKVYLITVFKINTRKQKYFGIRFAGEADSNVV